LTFKLYISESIKLNNQIYADLQTLNLFTANHGTAGLKEIVLADPEILDIFEQRR
jgi:hypothetical protein